MSLKLNWSTKQVLGQPDLHRKKKNCLIKMINKSRGEVRATEKRAERATEILIKIRSETERDRDLMNFEVKQTPSWES